MLSLAIKHLFEDLTRGVGVVLTVDDNGLLPQPLVLKVLLVLSLGRVKLGELVALVVGGDVENGEVLLAADNESTLDDRVVVLAIDGSAAKQVLARSLKTVVESANEVVGHERQSKLRVVLVVHTPDGVLLEGNVLPEVLERLLLLVVGVESLPLVQRVCRAWEKINRVLRLGSRGLLLSGGGGGSLRRGLRCGLGLLRLLRGDVGQLGLLKELDLVSDGGVDGLVGHGQVPPGDVGVGRAPLLVEEVLESAGDDASSEQISKGDALANKVGVVEEVSLDDIDDLGNSLGRIIDALLVVGLVAKQRLEPLAELAEELLIEEGHPLEDRGVTMKD